MSISLKGKCDSLPNDETGQSLKEAQRSPGDPAEDLSHESPTTSVFEIDHLLMRDPRPVVRSLFQFLSSDEITNLIITRLAMAQTDREPSFLSPPCAQSCRFLSSSTILRISGSSYPLHKC
ncbi:hypothetical protein M422DRAFT_251982 [Sphaerobolus stellatus SS14]|uniref:Uncharacterized protein n=1 Tax=Sphaerobolus stellatus (strain SS14) TaxID=990650 RepID=A0A0C9W161_SPHS4|nr:hypothetical protein M422DRAFT_251982 [Sphaerobolus stellatus SS14]